MAISKNTTETLTGQWRIVVDSIGDAGLRLIPAIQKAYPLPEPRIASLLYRAPSELISGLSYKPADEINRVLTSAGLDSRIMHKDEAFTPGDADHDVALVVNDMSRMAAVGLVIVEVLGVDVDKAREILFTSPTVLVGKVSANTVAALKRRFESLGAELDVSQPETAMYDLFLGECPPTDRVGVERLLEEKQIPFFEGQNEGNQALLAIGLSKSQVDKVWGGLSRRNMPVRAVNRDFQRFDILLEQAPCSKEIIEFLASTTGMSEEVAVKVTGCLPIVTHQNILFQEMEKYLDTISLLGGNASSHLLSFQTFSLKINELGDRDASLRLLGAIGDLDHPRAAEAMDITHQVEGPLTSPQARWLKWELAQVGTETEMVLR